MKVMVLAGGPDREREVSLLSGAQVAAALRRAGHDVIERDLAPADTASLDEFTAWKGDVVFPIFHGKWGEGGGAQKCLDDRGLAYVGCREAAARLCADKTKTKQALLDAGLPTPEFELVNAADRPALAPPVVVKPNDDGSSIDLAICHTQARLDAAWADLSSRNDTLLVERFIHGRELTVSVIESPSPRAPQETNTPELRSEPTENVSEGVAPKAPNAAGKVPGALPSIHIVSATEFYDYDAKYVRDDTQYHFGAVSPKLEQQMRRLSVDAFRVLGCRHLARVDLFLDENDRPWIIEVNTLPGCTTHSLLPMAAKRAGLDMPALMDQLVRLAAAEA